MYLHGQHIDSIKDKVTPVLIFSCVNELSKITTCRTFRDDLLS